MSDDPKADEDKLDEAEAAIVAALGAAVSSSSEHAPLKQVNFILRPGAIVAKSNSRVIFVCG
jgi:hypothetical protein